MRSRWVLNRAPALLALALLGATPPRTGETDGPLGWVRVSGGGYREARDVARLAEDVWHRLASLTGMPVDAAVKPMVRLELETGGPAGVRVVPGRAPDVLPWLFVVRGSFDDAYEELAEQTARMALWMWTGRPGEPGDAQADWLAVGLAQNLFPFPKSRNRERVLEWAEQGRLPDLETIFYWTLLPAGRMTEKAVCGHAVGWLFAEPGGRAKLAAVVKALREGRGAGPRVMRPLLATGPTQDVEAAWRAYALDRDSAPAGGRPLSPLLIARLRVTLATPAAELGLAEIPGADPLSPAQLLAVRGARGAEEAAQARMRALTLLAAGMPPELAEVALRYWAVFSAMPGWTPSFLLRRRLREADRRLRGIEDRMLAVSEWLDELDGAAGEPVPTEDEE